MPSSASPRSLSAPALSTLCKVSSVSAVLVSLPSFFPPRPSLRLHSPQSGSLALIQRTAIANPSASSSSLTPAQRMSANVTTSSSTPSMLSGPQSTPRTQRSLSAASPSAFSCKTSSPDLPSWVPLPTSILARAAPSFHSPANSRLAVPSRRSMAWSSMASLSASPGVAVVVCSSHFYYLLRCSL